MAITLLEAQQFFKNLMEKNSSDFIIPQKEQKRPKPRRVNWANQSNKTRYQKIRDNTILYPQSSENKLVFITNTSGNGFRAEKLKNFTYPCHIPVESMFKQINQACFGQWKIINQQLEKSSLFKIQKGVNILLFLIFLIILYFLCSVFFSRLQSIQIFGYILLALIVLLMIMGIAVCSSQLQQLDPNVLMVNTIKNKLIQINKREIEFYGEKVRFKWTCHIDCLWIAISF